MFTALWAYHTYVRHEYSVCSNTAPSAHCGRKRKRAKNDLREPPHERRLQPSLEHSKDEASRAQRVDIQARAVLHAVAERVPYAPEPVRLQAQSRSCSLSPRLLVGTCHDCTLRLQVSGIELLARFRLRRTCMRAPVVLLNPKEPRFNADACEHHCVARSCSTSAAACRQLQIAGRMANESGPLGHRCSTRSSGSTPKFSSAL